MWNCFQFEPVGQEEKSLKDVSIFSSVDILFGGDGAICVKRRVLYGKHSLKCFGFAVASRIAFV